MSRRQFQNAWQWPNAVEVRRDHPIARGLYWCFFPWKYPLGKAEANSTPNQQRARSAATLDLTGITTMPGYTQVRQPRSWMFVNKLEAPAGRLMSFSGTQLPMATDRGWTVLTRAQAIGTDPGFYLTRNYNLDAGVPVFALTSNTDDVTAYIGDSTATLYTQTTSDIGFSPAAGIVGPANMGSSYSAMHRVRVYGNRKYSEGTYNQGEFDVGDWTRDFVSSEQALIQWIMCWTRELEPSEVFSIFNNPAQILKQVHWRSAFLSPGVSYSLNAETGSYIYTGQDALFSTGKRLIAETGSYIYTGQSANLSAPNSIVAEGLTITVTDSLASG